jgi:hypothetical protein
MDAVCFLGGMNGLFKYNLYSIGFASQKFYTKTVITGRVVEVHLQSFSNLVVDGAVRLASGSGHFIPWRKPL